MADSCFTRAEEDPGISMAVALWEALWKALWEALGVALKVYGVYSADTLDCTESRLAKASTRCRERGADVNVDTYYSGARYRSTR